MLSVHDEALDRLAVALAAALPWVAFLPDADRRVFATESVETLRVCASVGRYAAFADLIEDWRNTAEVWSDPDLAALLAADIARRAVPAEDAASAARIEVQSGDGGRYGDQ
ncbi:hypothetical protein [Gordonia malaquae]|uniref:hypothetical protein n=1 Tax=Gordonia malaquae TaxID=410332 RepID=UPI0030FE129B